MTLRTRYLQSRLSVNGRNSIVGRKLYDRFKSVSEETLLAHFVYSDADFEGIKDPQVQRDVVSQSLFSQLGPNVVYVEGGLFVSRDGMWKMPPEIATRYCESGGILIVADVDSNELTNNKSSYRNAGNLIFKSYARYGRDDGDHPVYGSDQKHGFGGSHRQIFCQSNKMIIDEWLRPIYVDIPQILVGLPVCLFSWESLVASCNADSTGTLHLDSWVDEIDACPFASVAQVGAGFAVLISGLVSHDGWAQACPDNTRWLTTLASFLASEAAAERTRRSSHRRSPHLLFLSHRSTNKVVVSEIRKSIISHGVNVWYDEDQLIPSQSLTAEISGALNRMTHFVLFWSADCVGAPWVERELNSAIAMLIERKVPLIVVRLDQTPVPTIVADLMRIEGIGADSAEIGARIAQTVTRLEDKSRPL